MAKNIVIYNDEGVGAFGLSCLNHYFKDQDVWICTAESLIDGRVLGMADLFVMPGGADLPYCKKLDGAGNDNIRAYVEDGGTYLGLCAGAYYACRAIEFHKGRDDEICGARELAFAPCTAVGSLPDLAPYYDQTLHSAAIATLTLADGKIVQAFYQGGCRFDLSDGHDCTILARYHDLPDKPVAALKRSVGKGTVILSGVHFEITPDLLLTHPADKDGEVEKLKALVSAYKQPWKPDFEEEHGR